MSRVSETLSPAGTDAPQVGFDAGGVELFEYDGANRMTRSDADGVVTAYTYRADGLRSQKITGEGVTTHLWDGTNIAADLTDDAVTARYVRGINLLLSDTGDEEQFYIYNAHGDVVQLTNGNGALTKTYNYDAFGNEKDIDKTDTNPFRYSGEYYDSSSGNYYLRARYYDPATARWLSPDTHWNVGNMIYGDNPVKWNEVKSDEGDPLGLNAYTLVPDINAINQSGNLYVYSMNSPVMYVDPDGEVAFLAVIAAGAGAGLIAGAVASVVTQAVNGQKISLKAVGVSALDGAVQGATMVVPGGAPAKVVSGTTKVVATKVVYKSYIASNFRTNLQILTGNMGTGMQAHHVLPQADKFTKFFKQARLNVHDPKFGSWVNSSHQKWSGAYEKAWMDYMKKVPNATQAQILAKAKALAKEYGFKVNF